MTRLINNEKQQPVVPVMMPGNWLFGNARQVTADPLGMMVKAANMGRIVRMRFLTETAFMLRNPEDNQSLPISLWWWPTPLHWRAICLDGRRTVGGGAGSSLSHCGQAGVRAGTAAIGYAAAKGWDASDSA